MWLLQWINLGYLSKVFVGNASNAYQRALPSHPRAGSVISGIPAVIFCAWRESVPSKMITLTTSVLAALAACTCSAAQIAGDTTGMDIAPFARVVTCDPQRVDGTHAKRLEEFPAGDLFLESQIRASRNGWLRSSDVGKEPGLYWPPVGGTPRFD